MDLDQPSLTGHASTKRTTATAAGGRTPLQQLLAGHLQGSLDSSAASVCLASPSASAAVYQGVASNGLQQGVNPKLLDAQLVTRIERPDGTFKELDPERAMQLYRYRQKRMARLKAYAEGQKLIRYECRKVLADARPRVKGRFVKVDGDGGHAEASTATACDGKSSAAATTGGDTGSAGAGGVKGSDEQSVHGGGPASEMEIDSGMVFDGHAAASRQQVAAGTDRQGWVVDGLLVGALGQDAEDLFAAVMASDDP